MADVLAPLALSSLKIFAENLKKAQQAKKTYIQKLEAATNSIDIFKYLVLIDTSSLEGYVTQTRIQAEESFRLSKYVGVVGFILIAVGISLGIGTSIMGSIRLDAAYLASLAGILTEFISGVFFYLYSRTLQQMNLFHDKLLASKKIALDYLATFLEGKRKSPDELTTILEEAEKKIKESG